MGYSHRSFTIAQRPFSTPPLPHPPGTILDRSASCFRPYVRLTILAMSATLGIVGVRTARAQADDPNKLLVAAVEKNDLKAVLEALNQGAAPDTRDEYDEYPVSCLAARRGQTAILKTLLDHGANPEVRTKTDSTSLLIFSVHTANPDTVRLLLDRKVNVNLRNNLGETALNSVGETEAPGPPMRPVVMRMLLKAGADPEIRDREGRTALMIYADYGGASAVEVLADAGAKVNERDHDGNTALILAAGWLPGDTGLPNPEAYLSILKRLLKQGADLQAKNHDGETALTLAIRNDHPELASLLREQSVISNDEKPRRRTFANDLLGAAQKTANAMPDSKAATLALTRIAERQAQIGDKPGALQTIQMAKQTLQKIERDFDRTYPLAILTTLQAKLGEISIAQQVVANLPDGSQHENIYLKDQMRSAIACAQAEAGDVPGAQQTAGSIQNPNFQYDAQLSIAAAQKQEGDKEGAQQTLLLAQQKEEKHAVYGDDTTIRHILTIALAQTKAGDSAAARKSIRSALRIAQTTDQGDLKNRMLHDMADIQAQNRMTAEAQQTANRIPDPDCKSWALTRIAAAQVRAGDMTGARRTLAAALRTSAKIQDAFYRGTAQGAIVRGRIQAHDLVGAQQTALAIQDARNRDQALLSLVEAQNLTGAQQTAGGIQDTALRASALTRIAIMQRQKSDKAGAQRTLLRATKTAERSENLNIRVPVLLAIAMAQAYDREASHMTILHALQKAKAIRDADDRAAALQEIAETQAAIGDKEGTKQTIAGIDNARGRVFALLAAAEASGSRNLREP